MYSVIDVGDWVWPWLRVTVDQGGGSWWSDHVYVPVQ
jgi:hypothetical protein